MITNLKLILLGYIPFTKLYVLTENERIPKRAKLLVLAAKAQQEEIGDGDNLTTSFAGELLQELIRIGLHPSEIISGYMKGTNKTVEILESLVEKGSETMDVRNTEEVASRMKAVVASKQFDQGNILCPLIADACIPVCPKNPTNFNVDNVRVAKLQGGGLRNSMVIQGMVLKSDASGSIKKVEMAKVMSTRFKPVPGDNCTYISLYSPFTPK
ncbi:T-complex protein 1 subunit theta-like [Papaver somniferum]|uniref:T-complex protein 1 subunit theta-like n=1 Tax=Papaver somniferum TaxID=3469 RepID=UPI000E6F6066|nr:T-complex protein 1 subunit theta-like [Papaver somniferum]